MNNDINQLIDEEIAIDRCDEEIERISEAITIAECDSTDENEKPYSPTDDPESVENTIHYYDDNEVPTSSPQYHPRENSPVDLDDDTVEFDMEDYLQFLKVNGLYKHVESDQVDEVTSTTYIPTTPEYMERPCTPEERAYTSEE